MEAVTVAKSDKPTDDTKGKPGPKPDPDKVRSASILLKGRPVWKVWVLELAEHCHSPNTNELVDRALLYYAREMGFPKPAPKR